MTKKIRKRVTQVSFELVDQPNRANPFYLMEDVKQEVADKIDDIFEDDGCLIVKKLKIAIKK